MKVKLFVSTGYYGINHEDESEIDDEYIKDMNECELDEYLQSIAIDFMNEKIECSYQIIEE